ncbi:hypothetical protein CYMTET_17363 [Cymbomonas tetramitiformis]|uniref:Integrase zinc-binding domain-containing protein n=1 Tax=Cymbomonas tetramitiformis TaxID=36881 RepID=A0AAE0GAA9_9CHLO|nr:hypothetical protein CYMTET_17363 [Cymbomonas tetramitiformis]
MGNSFLVHTPPLQQSELHDIDTLFSPRMMLDDEERGSSIAAASHSEIMPAAAEARDVIGSSSSHVEGMEPIVAYPIDFTPDEEEQVLSYPIDFTPGKMGTSSAEHATPVSTTLLVWCIVADCRAVVCRHDVAVAWSMVTDLLDVGNGRAWLADTVRLTAMMTKVTQQEAFREKHPDIHEDALCLEWLKTGGSASIPKEDYHRVRKRAARHRWDELTGELCMITINGKELLDVKAVVTQCETCQRVKPHYAREEAMLTPLEIKSFMYRWSLDLAWPTKRVTKAGNQRILIMIEHYTRFICLIDRRVTSPDSPEGNGLTERVKATVPPDLRARPVLNFEEQEEKTLAEDLLQRAVIVKKLMVQLGGCSAP